MEQGCAVLGSDGELVALEGFVSDISERRRAEEALQASEAQYRQMFEQNRAIQLLFVPSTGSIVEANQAACEFYGYTRDEMRRLEISDLAAGSPMDVAAGISRARSQQKNYSSSSTDCLRASFATSRCTPAQSTSAGRQLLYSIIHDITERKRAEEALEHQAMHDGLTGLPNRLVLRDRLTQGDSHG